MGNDHTTQPHESDDRAFRFRSGAVVRAGWLAGDLPFLTRSLRFLLRAPADDLRAEFGLDAGDVGVLAVVDTNPGVTQNDLAASLVLKKSAVTRVVQRLEKRGVLIRRRSTEDRRANRLTLTPEGVRLAVAVRKAMTARHDTWFQDIAPADRAVFFDVLFRLVDHLAATVPPGEGGDED
ncbi:MAG: winged helix-turn-helix transcriptional regulator [Rhodobacter sp.]|uniref:MarR family winged helix-turn-helix transcriptional regulator n=1 Tax=Pararhodobacter sp. TaxID=2127056 RepID=UPI001D6650B6|nr:MarR family winged helix-turn-helix transcriptional regulator [Pararhodobacter sp.]MCB1344700.1 winged helix-turn-helix transcriptional regulator [Paracoccaceae bacterium]MCC0074348.1 winged helix-turn-helix transcriptional regulator [Rhodobacter sp.]HPD93933.1 MarR family winged helix-turn-helix transcriptional regulator [Pararhodobacter sp.]